MDADVNVADIAAGGDVVVAGRDVHINYGGKVQPSKGKGRGVPSKKTMEKAEASTPNNLLPQRLFVGREEAIEAIGAALSRGGQASVYGLGGVGKTALALEYAWRNLPSYPGGVYWVEAEGKPVEAMAKLGVVLRSTGPKAVRRMLAGLPMDTPAPHLAGAARSALQSQHEASLVILDNVGEEGFAQIVPASPVRVLVTTRDETLGLGQTALLAVLSETDAEGLAEKLAGERRGVEAKARERVVVTMLGGLTVAVEMAALSVKGWAESWRSYERHLRARTNELMNVREPHSGYPHSVTAALDLSLDRCERGSEAARLLEGMAVFAPNGVPMEWAEAAAKLDGASVEVKRARAMLKGLGLVSVDPERKTLSMHRLVHGRVRDRVFEKRPMSWWERWMPWTKAAEEDRERELAWVEAGGRGAECVADCLTATVGVEPGRRAEVEALRPHIQEALVAAERAGRDREWIAIAKQTATHLRHCALYGEARLLFERALGKAEALHPPDPQRVASCFHELAIVLHRLGQVGEALELFERAFAIYENIYGPEHPQLTEIMAWVATARTSAGRASEARPLFERALAIEEKTYSSDHPNVARRLSNLAELFQNLGLAGEARPMLERALAIDENTYGSMNDSVCIRLSKLASVLQDLGQVAEARPMHERALAIAEKIYGLEHPDVATCLARLAGVLQHLGRAGEARRMLERALAIYKRTYGPEHPNVARCLSNLAWVLQDLGQAKEARQMLERALAIQERTYGSEHPDVATCLSRLAWVLQDLGQAKEARQMLERALAMHETAYGPAHPRVAQDLSRLGAVLRDLGQPAQAKPLLERALSLHETLNSPSHPDTIRARERLASVLRDLASPT